MYRRIILLFVMALLVSGCAHLKRGTIIKYEDFRGYKVPIKADGKGGSYRWMADVPWDTFTIEEKFDWARIRGGLLSDKDVQEIKEKYGVK